MHISPNYRFSIFNQLVFFLFLSSNLLAQHYCERAVQSSDYYGSTELVRLNGYLYHGYSEASGYVSGVNPPRKNYILKTDDCLNIVDSVRVPLDSAFFCRLKYLCAVDDRLICLARSSDVEIYDTIGDQVKSEILVYDSLLNLVGRHNITKQLGVYNHNVEMDVLEDSLVMIRSITMTGSVDVLVSIYGLNGDLKHTAFDSLGVNGTVIGKYHDGSYFFWVRDKKVDFSLQPLMISGSIDTILHYSTLDDIRAGATIVHPNGYTYLIAEWSTFDFVKTHYGLRVFRFDSLGNNMVASVVLGDKDGKEEIFNKDAVSLAANGDIIIASGLSVADNGGEWNMLVTRIGEDMKLKWSKAIRVPNTPMLPTFSEGTADNGVTIISALHDPSTQDFSRSFNDLHYIHMDSTGYYSPLSIEDWDYMWKQSVSIYPNPVKDKFTLYGLDEVETYQVGLYDVSGNLLDRFALSFPFERECEELPSGQYLLILQDSQGNRISKRMIKE